MDGLNGDGGERRDVELSPLQLLCDRDVMISCDRCVIAMGCWMGWWEKSGE